MINILIFTILLASMFIFLILTFIFKNEALGGITLIFCLFLAVSFLTGIEYPTGTNITASGDNYITIDNNVSYSNIPIATIFFIMVLYLATQMITFRKERKRNQEEDIEI